MEHVRDCQYELNCRNPICSFNHPGRNECRYNLSCSRPQCWYNHKIRAVSKDPRDCKFAGSCVSVVCIFNHPGRPFCPTEEDCLEPTCQNNHQVLQCKYGLYGGECTNDFCEFRHSGVSRLEGLTKHSSEDSAWQGRKRRTKEMRVEDVIACIEGQFMFENEIGQFMYTGTEARKPWSSCNREVVCSQGKSLMVKIAGDGGDENSPAGCPQRESNLVILKDSEEGLDDSDLRHTLTPKTTEREEKVRIDLDAGRREWRYEGTSAGHTNRKLGLDLPSSQENANDKHGKIQSVVTLQPPQANLNILSQNSATKNITPHSQMLLQSESRGIRYRHSPEQSTVGGYKTTPTSRVKSILKRANKRTPTRLSTVKVKAADIETNAAVAAVIKKSRRELDSQESPESIADNTPARPLRQLPEDDNGKNRSLKRKYDHSGEDLSSFKSKRKIVVRIPDRQNPKYETCQKVSSYETLKIVPDKKNSTQITLEELPKVLPSKCVTNTNRNFNKKSKSHKS